MLDEYNKKRDFDRTPEPPGNKKRLTVNKSSKFVVQKHDASRLHYDFRLEDTKERVLKSWAIPKGISLNPKIKRLAVLTEDHPLDYLLFEGVIPQGSYGAGTVIVWDTGTYTSEEEISDQFKKGKITFSLFGHKLNGKFTLVRTHLDRKNEGKQWLLIKLADGFESNEELTITRPNSVLTRRINKDLEKEEEEENKSYKKKHETRVHFNKAFKIPDNQLNYHTSDITIFSNQQQEKIVEFPTTIKPMLSTLVDEPFNSKDWAFEVKWDGVRSILFFNKLKRTLELQSRNGRFITHRYPELVMALKSEPITSSNHSAINCNESAILDGEIVVLDKRTGIPSFQNHQRRMNIDSSREIEILSRELPATYYLFDILYLDEKNLQDLPFLERRKILSEVVRENTRIKKSDFIEEIGKEMFDTTKRMGLEGLIAKHKSSEYVQGIRSREWLKIKHIKTQDCIVIGYTRGEGNRENYFGSLLLAVNDSNGKLQFVGHTGSGFNFLLLKQIYNKLQKIRIEKCPVEYVPYTNRDPFWTQPELVVEIKFSNWTSEKIMRSPIFLRMREDKTPKECFLEREKYTEKLIKTGEVKNNDEEKNNIYYNIKDNNNNSEFSSFSNLDKVFWDKTINHPQITKKDLIEYYNKISKFILPYLKDRPLSLSRYPDGIKGKSFYHKNWNQENKPSFVQTVEVYSESREDKIINYIISNNNETILWLANLGCIEMHPWYSRINNFDSCKERDDILFNKKCGLNFPDFIVFDLDPYIYSGQEKNKGQKEPEYNIKAFRATVEVAFNLKELFDDLKIESYIKTSGKTGLHIFVPIANIYTYEQTRSFAEVIGKILIKRYPSKITMEWDTTKRTGKIFFDYNQNAKGKTIASIFSPRPTNTATVSFPIKWDDLSQVVPTDFTIFNVPNLLNKKIKNSWSNILEKKQNLNKILESIEEIL